ncbi:MAG: alpha/beta hydrolase [Acidobacteriota bacterium]|nr:alpha/beta hydrolase [Acidobacteriota bacterium]MDE3266265.1 alpha/beta hydrolase [Acidobacteriota bacterium]
MTRSTIIHPNRLLPSCMPLAAATVLLLAAGADTLEAQRSYPPEMAGTISEVYRTVGDVDLRMYLCNPEGHTADDQRPAIVFFFGGGWRAGSPQQFLPHCRYLAERGMVAAVADYRVASRHGVTADECVKDAKSAVRWLRANADRLGIDPNRIAAGGGSAGGHLAAATATLPGHDPDPEGPSAKPNALVLFNPATVLAPVDGDPPPTEEQRERFDGLTQRFGAPPESMSPYHHLGDGLPPTIVFHGTADETVAHSTAVRFCDGLRAHETRCDLVSYNGAGHGFFNFGRGEGDEKNKMYEDTVYRMDGFLYSLEWLDPKPNPDGTPRKRRTWDDVLGDALKPPPGGTALPRAADDEEKAEPPAPGQSRPDGSEEG